MDYLNSFYSMFRPLIAEISKQEIDFTKKEVSEIESELLEKWINKEFSNPLSYNERLKHYFFELLHYLDDNKNDNPSYSVKP